MQSFIESSKFEPGAASPEKIQRLTADVQSIFLVLLAIARHQNEKATLPESVREAMIRLNMDVAKALAAVAECVAGLGVTPCIDVDETMGAVERSLSEYEIPGRDMDGEPRGGLALYRELVAAVKRLASVDLAKPHHFVVPVPAVTSSANG